MTTQNVIRPFYARPMAGRPRSRAKTAAQAADELRLRAARAAIETDQERMGGREFEGHEPPEPPVLGLEEVEEAASDPVVRRHIAELWPLAYAALENVLTDPEASSASKVSAARIVQAARDAELEAATAAMPVTVRFETAAFVPEATAA